MSKEGFTPGPWRAEVGEQPETIAVLATGGVGHFEIVSDAELGDIDADARLIASAPTLLEALLIATSKPLAEHCTDEEWEFIRSAIFTAQGEQP